MPEPIAVCIEDLDDPPEQTRFIRCVALSGAEPGLGIDRRGKPLWRGSAPVERACELWVSADERLVLWRPPDAPPLTVRRAHRLLDVPAERAVLVLDGDELELGGAHLRLYVHGPTTDVHPPTPFWPRTVGAAAALATAVALGGAVGCATEQATADATSEASTATATDAMTASATTAPTATESTSAAPTGSPPLPTASASATVTGASSAKAPPIEVRVRPPKPVSPPRNDPLVF